MKISSWNLALSVAGALLASVAQAQSLDTALAADAYYAQGKDAAPSPSDKPAPAAAAPAPAADAAGGDCGCASSCDNGCGCCKPSCRKCCDSLCGFERCCELECPDVATKHLFDDNCWLKCRGITITGWMAAGVTANDHNAVDNFNGPVTFNDRQEAQLNQLYLVVEKAINNEGCGWDFGGRVDLMYGTDHRFTVSRGLETYDDFSPKWNSGRFYGLAMPQLYADVAYNDTTVRVGHFYTVIGYEVVPAISNFFYSHSYTMQYGEPFTHTGVMFMHKFNDQLSGHFCVHRGWDNWEDYAANDNLDYMAGLTFSDSEKKTSLALTLTTGEEANPTGFGPRTMYSLVFSKKLLCDRLTYVLQHDYGFQNNGDPTTAVPGGPFDAEWYGVNQYFLYQLNCCWSAGLRVEWFRDDDGTRVTGLGNGNAIAGRAFEGDFWEVTAGLNWKPNDNVTVRPELRYDWFNGTGNPYDAGNAQDQLTAAVDLIIQW